MCFELDTLRFLLRKPARSSIVQRSIAWLCSIYLTAGENTPAKLALLYWNHRHCDKGGMMTSAGVTIVIIQVLPDVHGVIPAEDLQFDKPETSK